MRAIPALVVALSVVSVSNASAAGSCDNDRYPCEPKIAKPALAVTEAAKPAVRSVDRKAAMRISPARRANEEKAPPDEPRAATKLKAASFWQPIDIPSQTVQPLDRKDPAVEVRVVSAEEFNEIDVAALSVPDPVKVVPIRVVWPEPPLPPRPASPQVSATPAAPAPVDTSLLERVMVTFGGAFGAASALRMFVG